MGWPATLGSRPRQTDGRTGVHRERSQAEGSQMSPESGSPEFESASLVRQWLLFRSFS